MSSEALERALRVLPENATRRNMLGLLMTCEPTHVLALLAEVARLEQERDDAHGLVRATKLRADCMQEEADGHLAARESAEAALAVAREREQPTREALAALLARHVALVESGDCGFWNVEEEPEVIAARAALVDEPAADEQRTRIMAAYEDGSGLAGQPPVRPASAAADEVQANAKERQTLGAASAAADEPATCPRCGNETTEADLTYSGCGVCRAEAAAADLVDAAADEPGETPFPTMEDLQHYD